MLKTNEYFDGNVKSIAFNSGALDSTVGVMEPGEYTFATERNETMKVISGSLVVKLPGADDWQQFDAGSSFDIAANASFDLQVTVQTAYLCTYE